MRDEAARSSRDRTIGYLEVVGAAALYGSAGIFTETLFDEGLPAASIAPLRLVIGTIALAATTAKIQPAGLRVGWYGLAFLGALGGVITAIFQLAEQLSFAAAGVTSTVALLYLAAMQAIPADLYESAAIDGAGRWKQFWHITVPMIRPTIIFTVIVSTIGGLQLFTEPYLFQPIKQGALGGSARQY